MPSATELDGSNRLKRLRSGGASSRVGVSTASFHTLPALAHDAVGGYLAWTDLLVVMRTSKWVCQLYRHHVKCLKLRARAMEKTKDGRVLWWLQRAALQRLFSRLPSLTEVHLPNMAAVGAMVEALGGGHVRHVENLYINDVPERWTKLLWRPELDELSVAIKAGALHALRSLSLGYMSMRGILALAIALITPGACPHFESLELRRGFDVVHLMAIATAFDTAFVKTPLQSLRLFGIVPLHALLLGLVLHRLLHDHGAQSSSLRELVLDGMLTQLHINDLSEAINTTRAVGLRTLTLRGTPCTARVDLAPLTAALQSGARHLRSLSIDNVECLNPHAACDALATAVRCGALAELEELVMLYKGVGGDGWSAVCQAIAQTHRCEKLRTLVVVDYQATSGVYGGLSAALSQGAMGGLCRLELWCSVASGDVRALAHAVEQHRLAQIEELELFDILSVDPAEFVTLTRALTAAGACPHLRQLRLSFDSSGCEGVVLLAQALKDGALSQLTELGLQYADLSGLCLSALTEALLAGACPSLQKLGLRVKASSTRECMDGIHALADVLAGKAACSRSLVGVIIVGVDLGPLSLRMLNDALRAPTAVRLSSLRIDSFCIDHECMQHLVSTLQGEAGSRLTNLVVVVGSELDDRDLQLWADAFYAGSMPQLTLFVLDSNVQVRGPPDAALEALRRRMLWRDGKAMEAGGIESWLKKKQRWNGSVAVRG